MSKQFIAKNNQKKLKNQLKKALRGIKINKHELNFLINNFWDDLFTVVGKLKIPVNIQNFGTFKISKGKYKTLKTKKVMLQIKNISALDHIDSFKILVYGVPGVGKTTFSTSGPKPLILNFDGTGIISIDNPTVDYIDVNKWSDALDISQARDEIIAQGYKVIVFDKANSMIDKCKNHLLSVNPVVNGQKNSLGTLSMKGYGNLKTQLLAFIKNFYDMGVTILINADVKEYNDNDMLLKRPSGEGSAIENLISDMDIVVFMNTIGNERYYHIDTHDDFYAKNRFSLSGKFLMKKEDPNLSMLMKMCNEKFIQRKKANDGKRQELADYMKKAEMFDSIEVFNKEIEYIKGITDKTEKLTKWQIVKDSAFRKGLVYAKENETFIKNPAHANT